MFRTRTEKLLKEDTSPLHIFILFVIIKSRLLSPLIPGPIQMHLIFSMGILSGATKVGCWNHYTCGWISVSCLGMWSAARVGRTQASPSLPVIWINYKHSYSPPPGPGLTTPPCSQGQPSDLLWLMKCQGLGHTYQDETSLSISLWVNMVTRAPYSPTLDM